MAQTNDIEDVLSSIRRLIADERTPETDPVARLTIKPAPRGASALLLDGSHRVTDPEDPFQRVPSLSIHERSDLNFVSPSARPKVAVAADRRPEPVDPGAVHPDVLSADRIASDTAGKKHALLLLGKPLTTEQDDELVTTEWDNDVSDEAAGLTGLLNPHTGDDVLRDLIGKTVRQELTGEMGDRILEDLRKLIRREIRQVLSAHKFD